MGQVWTARPQGAITTPGPLAEGARQGIAALRLNIVYHTPVGRTTASRFLFFPSRGSGHDREDHMPDFQRETFSFSPTAHPELVQWLATQPRGARSKAIVAVLEQRGQ